MLAWLPVLALLVVTPESLFNLGMGYADLTGSILLGTGAVALGLWFERGDDGYVAAATVLLAAAANTKDEDLVGVCAVLVIALIALLIRRRPGRLPTFIAALAVIAAFVVPWRIWVSAHHLSDSVEPPLAHALSPVYIFDRLHDLNISAAAMVSNGISGFPWLAPVFLATCIICLVTGTARRTACFYLGAFFGHRNRAAVALHDHAAEPGLPDPDQHGPYGQRLHGAIGLRGRAPGRDAGRSAHARVAALVVADPTRPPQLGQPVAQLALGVVGRVEARADRRCRHQLLG